MWGVASGSQECSPPHRLQPCGRQPLAQRHSAPPWLAALGPHRAGVFAASAAHPSQ